MKQRMAAPESPTAGNNAIIITTDNQLSVGVSKLRQNSSVSLASTLSANMDFCKICHCGGEINAPLITPCYCSGSLKHVHQECLQKWIKSSDIKRCELCKYPFAMQSKVKPFCEWEKLDMSSLERRKLICSVTFHVVAITCVVWSLYILIDRTADEIKSGDLKWPFWTKLVVVAIGFSGGLIFMHIQCKVYITLCRKWKAYNRIIVVQEAPEGIKKNNSVGNVAKKEESFAKHEDSLQSEARSTVASVATSTKSHAETQTAIRGVAIISTDGNATSAIIFKEVDIEKGDSGSSGSTNSATFFYDDCDPMPENNFNGIQCTESSRSSSLEENNSASHQIGHSCLGKLVKSRSSSGKWNKPVPTCTVNIGYTHAHCQGELPGSPIVFDPIDMEANQDQDLCSSL